MNSAIRYYRGSIHIVDELFSADIPGLKKGNRLGLIVSNNDNNKRKDTITVAMVNTSILEPITTEVVEFINELGEKNYVMCDEVHTVSKDWVSGKQLGTLDEDTMQKVNNGIALALNLSHKTKEQVNEVKKENTIEAEEKAVVQEPKTQEITEQIEVETEGNEEPTQNSMEQTQDSLESAAETKNEQPETEDVALGLKDIPEEELERKRNRKRGYWQLEEHMREFIEDANKYDTDTLVSMYNLKNKLVAYQLKNKFKKELGIATKRETNKNEDNTD